MALPRLRPGLLPILAVAAFVAPASLSAQAGAEWMERDATQPTVSPRLGAAGTKVTVRMDELSPSTSLLVGVGALGAGYEMLGPTRTDEEGRLEATVTLPPWVKPDAAYHFFVAYSDERAFAVSDVFLVPRADGTVRVEGVVGERSAGCLALRNDDDVLALVGETASLRPGQRVVVTAVAVEGAPCGDALALRVREVTVR